MVDLARPNTADVTAEATATMQPVCATDCLKPWCVPDRWTTWMAMKNTIRESRMTRS